MLYEWEPAAADALERSLRTNRVLSQLFLGTNDGFAPALSEALDRATRRNAAAQLLTGDVLGSLERDGELL